MKQIHVKRRTRPVSHLAMAAPVAAATLSAALLSSTASAGIILAAPAPVASGPGLGFVAVPAIVTVQANNDNVPAPQVLDNNIVVPLKRFDFNGIIDIEFFVQNSEGVTEYQFTEFVDNNTGVAWNSYRMVLGFGTGAGFVISPLGDGLDFDFPNYDTPPTSGAFPVVATPDEDQLTFSGGIHAGGAQPYTFRVDVPELGLRASPSFTLRQIPTPVPEPAGLAVITLTLSGVALNRRRR